MWIKRMLTAVLTTVFAFELCGCAALGAPATTEELLVRYVANENADNFSVEVNTKLGVNALGVRAAIPILVKLRAANNTAHGTVEVDLSSLKTRNYPIEIYAELLDNAINCYLGTRKGDKLSWKLWKIDMTAKIDIFTISDLLSASELTLLAKDSDPQVAYELAVPVSKVLKTAFEMTANPVELGGMGEQDLIDAVGDTKLRVGFNKDCLMRSLNTDVLLTFKSAQTNNVAVRSDVQISATLDDYGRVDPAEVAIPDSVRNEAVPTEEPVDVLEVIGEDSPLAGAVKR